MASKPQKCLPHTSEEWRPRSGVQDLVRTCCLSHRKLSSRLVFTESKGQGTPPGLFCKGLNAMNEDLAFMPPSLPKGPVELGYNIWEGHCHARVLHMLVLTALPGEWFAPLPCRIHCVLEEEFWLIPMLTWNSLRQTPTFKINILESVIERVSIC